MKPSSTNNEPAVVGKKTLGACWSSKRNLRSYKTNLIDSDSVKIITTVTEDSGII